MTKPNPIAILWTALLIMISISGVQAQQQTPAPTDAEIAAIVVAANNVDIQAGKYAKKTSANQQVKDFANQMVTDHTAVNKAATELVTKLKVKPQENELSKSLTADGKKTLAGLKKMKKAAFDKAYLENEVKFHESVIATIDDSLIPNAKNPDLKALLETYRPAFQSHLEHAQRLVKEMDQPKGSMQGT